MSNQQLSPQKKTCLITGGTSGIGKVTARALAQQGTQVVIGGRNQQKCEATVREIKSQTGNETVEYILADQSSMKDVQRMAETFLNRHQRLDVLVNNAGISSLTKQKSVDGYELTFATNYLGPFLLTNLLLDVLKKSQPARIVNVSSITHRWVKFNIDDPQKQIGIQNYFSSKFALVLFTYELARRLEGTSVTATILDPGVVATNIGRDSFPSNIIMALANVFSRAVSPEEGAQAQIYLATSPEVEGVTGKYFYGKKEIPSAKDTYNTEWSKRLWELSEKLTAPYLAQLHIEH